MGNRTKLLGIFIIGSYCILCSQTNGHMQINSSENIHFIVIDPQGRRTGADPRLPPLDTVYGVTFFREIPKAGYAFSGIGSTRANVQDPSETHEFMYTPSSPENDGIYTIQVIGVKLGKFWINAWIDPPARYHNRKDIHGVIDKYSLITYRFIYNRILGDSFSFMKAVDSRSLLQDIAAMHNLNWIEDQPTTDKYSNLISTYGRHVQQKDFGNARTTLESVLQTIPADSLTGLTTDACKLLRDDIQQLLNELPPAISSLRPMFTLAASDGFNLTVKGLPFVSGCSVTWNGSAKTTTFISANEVRGSILASDVATAGTSDVAVKTPDGKTSNSISFSVISAVDWVDTLIAYKHRAVDMGWLKSKQDDDSDDDEKPDEGVVRNLDNRLDKVKKELLRKDFSKARNELEKFVKKLDRMRKRSEEAEKRSQPNQVVLTVEGYNLLKTNTEYLIDHLPDRKPKKGSKDKD